MPEAREGSGKPDFLIDEPASNLHSAAQQKMVEGFVPMVGVALISNGSMALGYGQRLCGSPRTVTMGILSDLSE